MPDLLIGIREASEAGLMQDVAILEQRPELSWAPEYGVPFYLEKKALIGSGVNPFVDPAAWNAFLDTLRGNAERLFGR